MAVMMLQAKDAIRSRDVIDYAKSNGYGILLGDLASPRIARADDRPGVLKGIGDALIGFPNRVAAHGPFMDILPTSFDPSIRRASLDRIRDCLILAESYAIREVVFHANYNPLIGDSTYESTWIDDAGRCWRDIAMEFSQIQILLENMWEPSPDLFTRLLPLVGCDNVGMCLDVGHANVFGKPALREWIEAPKQYIRQVHLNDNFGKYDDEFAVGTGTIQWNDILPLLTELPQCEAFVIETQGIPMIKQSLRFLDGKL